MKHLSKLSRNRKFKHQSAPITSHIFCHRVYDPRAITIKVKLYRRIGHCTIKMHQWQEGPFISNMFINLPVCFSDLQLPLWRRRQKPFPRSIILRKMASLSTGRKVNTFFFLARPILQTYVFICLRDFAIVADFVAFVLLGAGSYIMSSSSLVNMISFLFVAVNFYRNTQYKNKYFVSYNKQK